MVWGRSAILGVVVMASGVVSHLLGAGRLPGPVALVLLSLACVVAVSCFLRVRATGVRLVLLVVGGQTLVHTALSTLAGHRGDGGGGGGVAPAPAAIPPLDPAAAERPTRFFDRYDALSAATPAPGGGEGGEDWLAHQIDHFTGQGLTMVAAHTLGAVAVALFLAVGERALWRMLLLTAVRARLRTSLWSLTVSAAGTRSGVARTAGLLGSPRVTPLRPALLDRRVRRHRGPPFVLAA